MNKKIYTFMTVGATIGMVAAFLQDAILSWVLFTIFFAIGLAGISGTLSRWVRLWIQTLSLITLASALWSLWRDTFVIGALCVFCAICFVSLLMVNGSWLRLNVADLPLNSHAKAWLFYLVRRQYDVFIWLFLGLLASGLMLFKLA